MTSHRDWDKKLTPFELELIGMRNMYIPAEHQFLEANKTINYRKFNDWNQVTSSWWANLMLSVCPQIEKMVQLLTSEMHLKLDSQDPIFYDFISALDSNKMVSIQAIGISDETIPDLIFYPYQSNSQEKLEWWEAYSKIIEEMPWGIKHATLHNGIYSLGALAILHHIAYVVRDWQAEDYNEILDGDQWYFDSEIGLKLQVKDDRMRFFDLPIRCASNLFYFPTRRFPIDSALSAFQ